MRRLSLTFPAVAVLFALPLLADSDSYEGREVQSRQVIVKFKPGSAAAVAKAVASHDIDDAREISRDGVLLLRSRSQDVARLVRELAAQPEVLYAEPNYVVHTFAAPSDPYFTYLWGLNNTGQSIQGVPGKAGVDIGAVPAWNTSTGSKSVVVGVVDTGVDYTHPDLAANVWAAPAAFSVTIGGVTINCPSGSHGFNAITNSCDPMDDNNHGSHVSGTIGAAANNGAGVAGVNWTSGILGLKFLDSTGSGSTANAIKAIEFALQVKALFPAQANVRVLSASWGGGGFSQSLLDEINKASAAGVLFVAAAGNSSANNDLTANYPSNYNAPNVVAVAAVDNTGALASFSNYGATTVDLGAPGVSILSTIRGANYAWYSGTSMATPHVSGAAALVLSRCNLDVAGLKSNLMGNTTALASLAGKTVTGGLLNVGNALNACAGTADFTMSATSLAPSSVTAGGSATSTVSIGTLNGFAGIVSLSASGLPAGAAATLSPSSVTVPGSSSLTITTAASTPAGTYPITITGTSGTLTHTASVSLTVTAPATPDFTISASPSTVAVTTGGTAGTAVTIAARNGFAGTVSLAASGLPSGVTASLSPASVAGSGTSTLTFAASASAALGTFTVSITGTSGSLSHSTTVTLTVKAPSTGSFTLTASPSSRSIWNGYRASYTVSVVPSGGFNSPVTLSVSGLPPSSTASFNPQTLPGTGGSSTLSVQTYYYSTPPGSYRLTITATGGGIARTTSVMLYDYGW